VAVAGICPTLLTMRGTGGSSSVSRDATTSTGEWLVRLPALKVGSSTCHRRVLAGGGHFDGHGVTSGWKMGMPNAPSDRRDPRSIDEDRRSSKCRGLEVTTPGHRVRAGAQN
jgi:hypothetical protein